MIEYPIPTKLRPFADAALTRLKAIRSDLRITIADEVITIQNYGEEEQSDIEKLIAHTLYREKIYQETLPLRTLLVEKLMR